MAASLPAGERKKGRRIIQLTIERMTTAAYNISDWCQFKFLDVKKPFWTEWIMGRWTPGWVFCGNILWRESAPWSFRQGDALSSVKVSLARAASLTVDTARRAGISSVGRRGIALSRAGRSLTLHRGD